MIRVGRQAAMLALLALAAVIGVSVGPTIAPFGDSAIASGGFVADSLDPPTALVASVGGGVVLSWTPTADVYATGYAVLRGTTPGGPYASVGTTSAALPSYSDAPPPGDYVYVVRSTYAGWTSPSSAEVTAGVDTGPTAPATCAAQVPDAGGDGDGYESSPASACGDDGAFARDVNSGTNNNTGCGNAGKDKHRFWDFGLDVPASVSSIDGIELRADAYVTPATGVNRLCAQLSWNGGSNWTAAKQLNLAGAETTLVFGGPADRWGRTWTPAQLGNADFRVRLIDAANNTARTFHLDEVRVVITWTR
jgi:hypothetical protein